MLARKIGIASLLAFSATVVAQTPRGFEVVQLTNTVDTDRRPRINLAGQVVFGRQYTLPNADFFWFDGRQVAPFFPEVEFRWAPDINDRGEVVWICWCGLPNQNGDPTTEIMIRRLDGRIDQLTHDAMNDSSPRINNRGQVVWNQDGYNVFFYDGKETTQITHDGRQGVASHQGPTINDLGQIVWTRYDYGPGPDIRDAMLYSGGEIQSLTEGTTRAGPPSINNLTQVVWSQPEQIDGLRVIRLWDEGRTTTVAEDGVSPVINDRGDIAFLRQTPQYNVFLLRDGRLHEITTSTTMLNSVGDINNEGEVTWQAGSRSANIWYLHRFEVGDLNCDGNINPHDVEAFALALVNPGVYDQTHPHCDPMLADVNGDGAVDSFDVDPFIHLLQGP